MEIIDKRIPVGEQKIFTIVPIGDIHFNSLSFDEKSWQKFLKAINEEIKNPLYIFVGDIIDDDRPSTRDRRKMMFFDRNEAYKAEDEMYLKWMINNIIPRLKFLTPDNCLGILDGDHYRVFSNGVTSTEVICKALQVPYLGSGQAIIRLIFQLKHSSRLFVIHARHGRGFQSTIGGKINANQKFVNAWEGIDLFIKGHSHSAWEDCGVRNCISREGFLYEKSIYTINAGSFKKTFIMREEQEQFKKVMREKIKALKNKENLIRELEHFIGIKEHDVDYPEMREYPPVNKNLIGFQIKIVKSKKLKGYADYELRKSIIEIEI